MSIYKEYVSELDRDYDILSKRFDIETGRIYNMYEYTSFIENSLGDSIVLEAEDGAKNPSKFKAFIKKIIDAITTLIKDVIEMFSNIFSRKDDITPDDFKASETAKIQFEYDVLKVEQQVADEVRKGRKMIQAISKKTGIDDATVEEYADKSASFLRKNGRKVAGIVLTVGGGLLLYKQGIKELKKTSDEVKKAQKDAEAVAGDPAKEKLVAKIIRGMQSKVKVGTDAVKHYGTKLEKGLEKSKLGQSIDGVKKNINDKVNKVKEGIEDKRNLDKQLDMGMKRVDDIKNDMNSTVKGTEEFKNLKNEYNKELKKLNKINKKREQRKK